MPGPSNLEQYVLELLNEARLDPLGNAARYITSYSPLVSSDADVQNNLDYFQVDGATLLAAFNALTPVQPLAWNESLASAARTHDTNMINYMPGPPPDTQQQHQLPGEPDLLTRVQTAGYTLPSGGGVAENIFAYATSGLEMHAAWMIDWGGPPPSGIQSPPGHRENIMRASRREVGVGIVPEGTSQNEVGPLVATEDFGTRNGLGPILLGVAYTDSDHDHFYSQGEGLGNLTVAVAGGGNVTSFASGGYTLETVAGNATVTFSGAGLAGDVTAALTLGTSSNVKLDIIDGNSLHSSGNVAVTGAVSSIIGLGVLGLTLEGDGNVSRSIVGTKSADSLIGGNVGDTLTGGLGDDTVNGGSNVDTAVYSGNRTSYTITHVGLNATISGPDGSDTVISIERLQFADGTLQLPRGSGVSLDLAHADPDSYMASIRDFDGNNLGAPTDWSQIGSADVQNDGDTEYLYVNRTIGRWATVGAAYDGLAYFDNYSWGGDTRVVGIYIDPLVEAGIVAPNSDFDSQRRFQNDLFIDNIHSVLGAQDYDGDGLQEVYFSLTDGTAYLHAYMHADGNIRYANYQNEQQVKDYLTSHGFGPSTWAGWFPSGQAPLSAAGDSIDAYSPVIGAHIQTVSTSPNSDRVTMFAEQKTHHLFAYSV